MTTITIKDPEITQFSKENPLVLDRIIKRQDGGTDVILALTKEQQYVLLEFAIMALTANGLARIQDEHEASKEAGPEEAEEVVKGEQVH